MPVDPKEQNAELQKLIGANKQRLAHAQSMLRELQKRTIAGNSRDSHRQKNHDKSV